MPIVNCNQVNREGEIDLGEDSFTLFPVITDNTDPPLFTQALAKTIDMEVWVE